MRDGLDLKKRAHTRLFDQPRKKKHLSIVSEQCVNHFKRFLVLFGIRYWLMLSPEDIAGYVQSVHCTGPLLNTSQIIFN